MSDLVHIRQKYKEITGNANTDDIPIYVMRNVVKAYQQGRADAFKRSIIILSGIDRQVAEIFKDIVNLEQLKEGRLNDE